jgi:endonuclease YncB( thermonuclease family)
MNKLLHLILLLTFFPVSALAAPSFPARVVSIQDGDTITVLTEDKRQVRIRLYGIDCPEKGQPYGNRARQATAEAVHGKDVDVRQIDTDRYGRTVAMVSVQGGDTLNAMLVRAGLAWVYEKFCTRADPCDRLRELERAARARKAGLWKDGSAVEPWVWRKRK